MRECIGGNSWVVGVQVLQWAEGRGGVLSMLRATNTCKSVMKHCYQHGCMMAMAMIIAMIYCGKCSKHLRRTQENP
jgi:hypothetical protein